MECPHEFCVTGVAAKMRSVRKYFAFNGVEISRSICSLKYVVIFGGDLNGQHTQTRVCCEEPHTPFRVKYAHNI